MEHSMHRASGEAGKIAPKIKYDPCNSLPRVVTLEYLDILAC